MRALNEVAREAGRHPEGSSISHGAVRTRSRHVLTLSGPCVLAAPALGARLGFTWSFSGARPPERPRATPTGFRESKPRPDDRMESLMELLFLTRTLPLLMGLGVLACLSSCGVKTPLEPVNRSPVVQSLIAFPASISPGDSAVVVCHATDPDGDGVVFDWFWYGRLNTGLSDGSALNRGNTLVVRAGTGGAAPVDTGGVSCFVRDRRGGGASAGTVLIVIRQ